MKLCIMALTAGVMFVTFPDASADAQADLPVYTDHLVNGFQDWSWAPRNLDNPSPVHSGAASISVSASAWQGISFEEPIWNSYQGGFDATPYSNFVFWANGGAQGGQILQVYAQFGADGVEGPEIDLPPLPTNSWRQIVVPVSSLSSAPATNLNRITLQLTSYGSANTFYLDDIAFTAAPAPALAHLFVDAFARVRLADARWFGVNTAVWDDNLDTATTSNAIQQVGIQCLRFPGGSLSDDYHWASGETITWDTNGLATGTNTWASDFGNFMHVATNCGAQTFITVNYGSGTSNEAAAWVAEANVNHHCGFRYWELGNEVYGSWETDTNQPPNDPYTYAVRFAGYMSLMKAADPTIKVGLVAVPGEDSFANYTNHSAFNPRTGQTHYGWTPVMLTTLANLEVTPDFMIYHSYPEYTPFESPAPADDSDALVLQVSSEWAGDAASLRQMIGDYFGPGGTNIELVCTENNSDAGAEGRQITSLVNALYLADTLGQLMKTEFNAWHWWDLRNGSSTAGSFDPTLYGWRAVGDEGMIGGLNTFYPPYYALKLTRRFLGPGDAVLDAASDFPLLSAYAARRADGTLALLVLNKDTVTNLTAQIELTNFTPASTALLYSYGEPQDNAAKTDGSAASRDIFATNYLFAAPLFTNSFPPLTMTLFVFTPASPILQVLPAPAGEFVLQLTGQPGGTYVIETSTDLITWTAVSTNLLSGDALDLTNLITAGQRYQFWRAR